MEYLLLVISAWMILILVLSFVKIKVGVFLFLIYMVCVPYVMIRIGGTVWGANVVNTIFLASFLLYVYQKRIKVDWTPFTPFIVYFLMLLVALPFQSGLPLANMFDMWRRDVMMFLFLPFVMWNIMKNDVTSISFFRKSIVIAIIIAVAYGLFLTTQGGNNPYQMAMLLISGETETDWVSYYGALGTGRLFGRISSVFQHPMQFALFLGLALIYVFYNRNFFSKKVFLAISLAISVMAIVCGVRSVLGGIIVALVFYFVMGRNVKVAMSISFFGALLFFAVSQIPELSAYVNSIADINSKSNAVAGSSVDMRMNQFYGALEEVKENPFWGLGYGWTVYYQALYGDHPICLAFESLIFVITCNSGLYGFIVWGILGMMVIRNNAKMKVQEKTVIDSLFVFYIAYACITGDGGYMRWILVFYVLMLGTSLEMKKQEEGEIDSKEGEVKDDKSSVV